jgi:hypothetical protein
MTLRYPVKLEADDNGTVLATDHELECALARVPALGPSESVHKSCRSPPPRESSALISVES